MKTTLDYLLENLGTILGVLASIGSLGWYFVKQYFRLQENEKKYERNFKALEDWMVTFQKSNTEKHEEFNQELLENKEKVQLKLELLKSELENRMLKDKEDSMLYLNKFSDKLEAFGNTLTKVSLSNEFMAKTLEGMYERQNRQDELNLTLVRELSSRHKKD